MLDQGRSVGQAWEHVDPCCILGDMNNLLMLDGECPFRAINFRETFPHVYRAWKASFPAGLTNPKRWSLQNIQRWKWDTTHFHMRMFVNIAIRIIEFDTQDISEEVRTHVCTHVRAH